ncbi:ABC transporter substrate-binding protein [Aquihabitans sp. McL0605]|uniref:ABC transporter substrate-binding protein n=1 Tax=Aquihabitans sp. McL0605 TaxID=3415671 RepID=UPI003CFBA5E1
MQTVRKHHLVAVGLAGALLFGTAACGSSGGSDSSGATTTAASGSTKDAKIAAMVPSKLTDAGKIVVAADASYAPNEFFDTDNKTVIGMDADLAKALGDVMGLKVEVTNAGFDTIIPALGHRYDIGMSSFTDNLERQKTVDFVDYFSAGTSFYVPAGKNADLTTLDSLCGHTVGVEKGTTQQDDATAQSKTCTSAGKDAVTVTSFPDQSGANTALASGRVDVVMADSPVAAYAVKQSNGKFDLGAKEYGDAPYGIALPKSSEYAGLDKAIQASLQKLDADGTYDEIMEKWGVEAGEVKEFPINGATS